MKKQILLLCVAWSFGTASFAQTSTMPGFRRNFAIVAFAGIGGAVLGLSTLSFYGNPQERVGNITTGFLIGVVGGGVYVASDVTPAGSTRTSSDSFSLIDNKLGRSSVRQVSQIKIPLLIADF